MLYALSSFGCKASEARFRGGGLQRFAAVVWGVTDCAIPALRAMFFITSSAQRACIWLRNQGTRRGVRASGA